MFSTVHSFLHGLILPLKAAFLLVRSPTLWLWAALPTLFTGLMYFLIFRLLLNTFQPLLPTWLTYTMGGLILLIGVFFFSTASTLIAGPFYDWLAEKTENLPAVALPPAPAEQTGTTAKLRHFWIDFSKGLLAIAGYLLCLFCSWIPLINILGAVLSFGLISYQFVSYSQTRRGIGPWRSVQILAQNWPQTLGMGMALAAPLSIPVLSLFILPIAVISGTLLTKKIYY